MLGPGPLGLLEALGLPGGPKYVDQFFAFVGNMFLTSLIALVNINGNYKKEIYSFMFQYIVLLNHIFDFVESSYVPIICTLISILQFDKCIQILCI